MPRRGGRPWRADGPWPRSSPGRRPPASPTTPCTPPPGMSTEPRVAAVIVSYNARPELLRGLIALGREAPAVEIVVVDNASTDGSAEAVARDFPGVRLVANRENVGFARATNQGIAASTAPHVLVINSDAEVRPGAVAALLLCLEARPRRALVGPRTLNPDGTVQVSFGPDLALAAEWRQRRLVRGVRRRDAAALRQAEAAASREHAP